MSNSKLVSYTKLSPNYTKMTNKKNKKITIHHMAGNLSVEACGNVFQSRQASSNYGIGTDGRIALYVDEANRSWCSSSSANDSQAVTIEVANNSGAPNWTVSDKAYNALLDLCEDICRRNGIEKLVFTGDARGNLTQHNYFAATACPGAYLKSRFNDIANEVNRRLGAADADAEKEQEKGAVTVTVELNQLSKGSTGAQVKTLQRLLLALGFKMGSYGVDGSFGNATLSAVKNFQKARGLTVDGLVGKQTWSALLK